MKNEFNVANVKIDVLVTQGKGSSSKLKVFLPDVEKFMALFYSFETWFPVMEAKFRIDKDAIGSFEA